MATFYLSSTFEDLKDCRELVSAALQETGHRVVSMENYTVSGTAPLKKCLADVAGCNAYIGIFAWRYGYVPEDDDNPAHKSITELEYLEAVERGLEPLIFILSEKASWPQNHVDSDKRQIEKLRGDLSKKHIVGLFKDCEELTRRVLAAVAERFPIQQMDAWSSKARKDYPELWVEVLREALNNKRFKVSQNAAILVGKQRVEILSSELVRLALSGVKSDVRRAATVSLVRFDDPKLYEELIKKLNEPKTRDRALSALAHTRVAADSEPAPEFEKVFSQRLSRGERARIRRIAWKLRFREEWPAILFIGFLAGVFGAVSASAFKWLPGWYGFAVTQAQPSAGMGAFQGLTAGFIWAGAIVLGLTLHDRVFARKHGSKGYFSPFGGVVSGAMWGLLGSLVIVYIIVLVFATDSLVKMGWITVAEDSLIYKFNEMLCVTYFGYVHLITGFGLGVGMALMTNGLRASQRWTEFVEEHQSKLFRLRQRNKILVQITRIASHHVLPLLLALACAAAAAWLVPKVPPGADKYYSNDRATNLPADLAVALSIAGDCLSQAIGGFFGIVGMGLGIIIVRNGFEFRPRRQRF